MVTTHYSTQTGHPNTLWALCGVWEVDDPERYLDTGLAVNGTHLFDSTMADVDCVGCMAEAALDDDAFATSPICELAEYFGYSDEMLYALVEQIAGCVA